MVGWIWVRHDASVLPSERTSGTSSLHEPMIVVSRSVVVSAGVLGRYTSLSLILAQPAPRIHRGGRGRADRAALQSLPPSSSRSLPVRSTRGSDAADLAGDHGGRASRATRSGGPDRRSRWRRARHQLDPRRGGCDRDAATSPARNDAAISVATTSVPPSDIRPAACPAHDGVHDRSPHTPRSAAGCDTGRVFSPTWRHASIPAPRVSTACASTCSTQGSPS